jgi:hypothetical protein
MGYKKIKLVGIDLNNESYFFNINKNFHYRSATQITNIIKSQNSLNGFKRTTHATACNKNAKFKNCLNIIDYILFLQNHIFPKFKVKIFNTNKLSLLNNYIEYEGI